MHNDLCIEFKNKLDSLSDKIFSDYIATHALIMEIIDIDTYYNIFTYENKTYTHNLLEYVRSKVTKINVIIHIATTRKIAAINDYTEINNIITRLHMNNNEIITCNGNNINWIIW